MANDRKPRTLIVDLHETGNSVPLRFPSQRDKPCIEIAKYTTLRNAVVHGTRKIALQSAQSAKTD